MKKLFWVIIGISSLSLVACEKKDATSGGDSKKAKSSVKLKNEADSIAYAIGAQIGNSMVSEDMKELDPALIEAGIKDMLANKEAAISEKEAPVLMQNYMQKKMADMPKKNQEKGDKFLAENKAKKGIITTPSGLQYEVVKMGTGPKPTITDSVNVVYEGKLLSGKVFDSSKEENREVGFRLGNVIKGWTEGVQLMPEGSTFIFYVPAALAYGETGAAPVIGPNEVLTFEVQLKSVSK
ncbi:MAG: FKBP-type peptidyl-prolyl cis-trans isomerase [Bacteroidetes bacterium]|nr:FKBP-type peptidyl-prolyl cis-trans isomerase [Bacteroidota bacterium]